MAKLSDLHLDPTDGPGSTTSSVRSEDDQRRISSFLSLAELLLDDDLYEFAWPTVQSMRDDVQAGRMPTEKMFVALENIKEGARRHRQQERNWNRRGGSRRYEGYRR